MKIISFLVTKESISELLISLLISFLIFVFDFGGIPHGEWFALNIYPFLAGVGLWILIRVITVFVKPKNKFIYYPVVFLSGILLCIAFIYML